jgi:DNA-binding transcriptional regulator YdaS (Cro superfamily)
MKLLDYIKSERGNAKLLSDKLKVSPSFLSQLASGKSPISPERCVLIEQHTDGKVRRQDLRDDWMAIWPELKDRVAA